MATYRCLADLQGKTLCYGDFVYFDKLEYIVNNSFLSCFDRNDQVFEKFYIDRLNISKQTYGYPSLGGTWPECKNNDYPALTRLVIEIYKIIEKTSITSEKEQWYKITNPGKTGISPEQVKELIVKYGGIVRKCFNYCTEGIYYWKKGHLVHISPINSSVTAIEVSPTTITIKKEEKHETQFQRKKARIERGTRPEGSTVCGRRGKASVAVGHLGYRKVTGI